MYCPRCGSGNQEPENYCRNCGEFLLDYTGLSFLLGRLLRGSSPTNQVYLNLALSLITILTSFLLIGFLNGYYDARAARTGEEAPRIIYLVYAFLTVISLWQILSIVVGVRLGRKLGQKRSLQVITGSEEASESSGSRETEKLLKHPLQNENLPNPVIEESTRILERSKHKIDQLKPTR